MSFKKLYIKALILIISLVFTACGAGIRGGGKNAGIVPLPTPFKNLPPENSKKQIAKIAPTNLKVELVGDTATVSTWDMDKNAGHIGFVMQRSSDGRKTWVDLEPVDSGVRKYSDIDKDMKLLSQKYFYQVVANYADGRSEPSNVAQAGKPPVLPLVAKKLVVKGPLSLTIGSCGKYSAEALDDSDTSAPISLALSVSLSTTGAGQFYADSACSSVLSVFAMLTGTFSKEFYFKGTSAGKASLFATNSTLASTPLSIDVLSAGAVAITKLTPDNGSVDGKETIVVTGSNFASGAIVKFDSATIIPSYKSSGELSFVTPTGTVKPVTVQVINPNGEFSNTVTFNFKLAPPEITGLTPSFGTIGDPIAVEGKNFSEFAKVTIDGADAPTKFVSSTKLTVTLTTHGPTGAKINVINPDLQSAKAFDFSYVNAAAPASLSFSVSSMDFGSPVQGGFVKKDVTLTNSGGIAAVISNVSFGTQFGFHSGSAALGSFPGVGGDCKTTIDPGKTCILSLEFTADSLGFRSSPFDLSYASAPGAIKQISVGLSGTGAATASPANLFLSTPTTDMGNVTFGTNSSQYSVLVENKGGSSATNIALVNSYNLVSSTCSTSLDANRNCTLVVSKAGTPLGPFGGSLYLTYSGGSAATSNSIGFTGTVVSAVTPTCTASITSGNSATIDVNSSGVPTARSSTVGIRIDSNQSMGSYSITGGGFSALSHTGFGTNQINLTGNFGYSGNVNLSVEIFNSSNVSIATCSSSLLINTVSPAAPANLVLSTSITNMGNITYGTNSAQHSVLVENKGASSATNIALVNSYNLVSSTCGTTLDANRNCTLIISKGGTPLGPFGGSLYLTYSGGNAGSSNSIGFTGTVVSAVTPTCTASITSGNPATIDVNSSGVPTARSSTVGIRIDSNVTMGSYGITGGGFSPITHSGHGTQQFNITANFGYSGNVNLSVEIFNSSGVSIATCSSSLLINTVSPAAPANLVLSTSTTDMGNITFGTNSAQYSVLVENKGASSATNIALVNSYNLVSSTCGTTLDANRNCTLIISKGGTPLGPFGGSLYLTYSGGSAGSSNSIGFTGTVVPAATPANLVIASLYSSIGNVTKGSTSGSLIVTVENKGGSTATSLDIQVVSAFTLVSKTCQTQIGAGATCSYTLSRSNSTVGYFSDRMYLTYQDGGTKYSNDLYFTGTVAAPTPNCTATIISGDPATISVNPLGAAIAKSSAVVIQVSSNQASFGYSITGANNAFGVVSSTGLGTSQVNLNGNFSVPGAHTVTFDINNNAGVFLATCKTSTVNVNAVLAPNSALFNITGPNPVLTNDCVRYEVETRSSSNVGMITNSDLTVNVAAAGQGQIYSDVNCSQTATQIVVAKGTSSKHFYYKSTVKGTVGLSANATGFPQGYLMVAINAPVGPTRLVTHVDQLINTGVCKSYSVETFDGNVSTPTNANMKVTIWDNQGILLAYSDSNCSTRIWDVTMLAGKATASFYLKSTVAGTTELYFEATGLPRVSTSIQISNPAPTITSLSTNSANIGGGTKVTVYGTNFAAGARVSIDGTNFTGNIISSTELNFTTVAHPFASTYTIQVFNRDDQGSAKWPFSYAAPIISLSGDIDFGIVAKKSSINKILRVTNTGTVATKISVSSPPSAPFSYTGGGSFPGSDGIGYWCKDAELAPNAFCDIALTFTATSIFTATQNYSVSAVGSNASYSVTLKGKGK